MIEKTCEERGLRGFGVSIGETLRRYSQRSVDWVGIALYFGGGGFLVALVVGIPLLARGASLTVVTALGVAAAAIYFGYWLWWNSQPCGEGCTRDASIPLVSTPFQYVGWCLGTVSAFLFVQHRDSALRRERLGPGSG